MSDIIIPPGMEAVSETYRNAPARRVGDMLFICGQVGTIGEGLALADGIAGQVNAAFENIGAILKAAKMDFSDVVDIHSFHIGDVTDHVEPMVDAIKVYMGGHRPVMTCIGTPSLGLPGALVEIKAVAAAS